MSQNGEALDNATDVLRGDQEIVLAAVSEYGWALRFATEELRGDRQIVMTAVSQNGMVLYLVCHYSRDRSQSAIVIGVISEPFASEFK